MKHHTQASLEYWGTPHPTDSTVVTLTLLLCVVLPIYVVKCPIGHFKGGIGYCRVELSWYCCCCIITVKWNRAGPRACPLYCLYSILYSIEFGFMRVHQSKVHMVPMPCCTVLELAGWDGIKLLLVSIVYCLLSIAPMVPTCGFYTQLRVRPGRCILL